MNNLNNTSYQVNSSDYILNTKDTETREYIEEHKLNVG